MSSQDPPGTSPDRASPDLCVLAAGMDVAHVARLARLRLEPGEAETMGAQLGAILGYFAKLAEVDVEGVEPMTHAAELTLRRPANGEPGGLRPDEVRPPLGADEGLAAAPRRDGPLVEVPRILGEVP